MFNKLIRYIFCSNSRNSIPPIIKTELYSHKIARLKKEVISPLFVSLLNNITFYEFGLLLVK